MFARVQNNDFSQQQLYDELAADSVLQGAGAIVTFTGLVRDFNAQGGIQGIELEYYPGMTESTLEALLAQASQRFDIVDAGIVHRVGKLAYHAALHPPLLVAVVVAVVVADVIRTVGIRLCDDAETAVPKADLVAHCEPPLVVGIGRARLRARRGLRGRERALARESELALRGLMSALVLLASVRPLLQPALVLLGVRSTEVLRGANANHHAGRDGARASISRTCAAGFSSSCWIRSRRSLICATACRERWLRGVLGRSRARPHLLFCQYFLGSARPVASSPSTARRLVIRRHPIRVGRHWDSLCRNRLAPGGEWGGLGDDR